MADMVSWREKHGFTPARMRLIGVLGMVLIAALYFRFAGGVWGTSAADDLPSRPRRPRLPRTHIATTKPSQEEVVAHQPAADLQSALDGTSWAHVGLEDALQHDPFARPGAFPAGARESHSVDDVVEIEQETPAERIEEQVATAQADLETLRRQGVNVIIRHQDQYVALVGDRTLRVGDEIDGFKIVAIRADGIEVEREISP